MAATRDPSLSRLALVSAARRREIARLGGLARKAKAAPERLREIALAGVAGRMAKLSPERRSEIARAAGVVGNMKRWGQPGKEVQHDGNGSRNERQDPQA